MPRSRGTRSSAATLHLMLVPAIVIVLIYAYGPMFGVVMAFQKFNPGLGFFRSRWVGLANFDYLLKLPDFPRVILNTLYIAAAKTILRISLPLVLALLVNEVMQKTFKRTVQTAVFIPFFLSWAVLGGAIFDIFSLDGPINAVIKAVGRDPIFFLGSNKWFPPIMIITDTWKGQGYNMIIFLAAITNIDPNLYEASQIDGAGRWRQLQFITIPGMMPILVLVATLNLGGILNAGFEQILILYNPIVYQSADIIDTYVYRLGLFSMQYSVAAAAGLFRSVVSLALVSLSYWLAFKFSDYRIF
jgi:putative aldouronate transport system permease protein